MGVNLSLLLVHDIKLQVAEFVRIRMYLFIGAKFAASRFFTTSTTGTIGSLRNHIHVSGQAFEFSGYVT